MPFELLRILVYAFNPLMALIGEIAMVRSQSNSSFMVGLLLVFAGVINVLAVLEADRQIKKGN